MTVVDSTGEFGAGLELTPTSVNDKPIDVTLARGAVYTGTITDGDGKPLAGCGVSLVGKLIPLEEGGRTFYQYQSFGGALTDNDGRYRIAGVVVPADQTELTLKASPSHRSNQMQGDYEDYAVDADPAKHHDDMDFVITTEFVEFDEMPGRRIEKYTVKKKK